MVWLKVRIKTITEAEDVIVAECFDIGLEGAQIEDDIPLTALEKEQMFVDILPEKEEISDIAYVTFFLEKKSSKDNIPGYLVNGEVIAKEELEVRVKDVLEEIKSYMDIGEGTVELDETEDIDWVNNWKKFFHQFEVGGMLVLPSWEEAEEPYRELPVLNIDPGAAFGTGSHETTRLCINRIRKHLNKGDRLLDVGTGSGILSIFALMNGAGGCIATDLDPLAIDTAKDNLELNKLLSDDDYCHLYLGNIAEDEKLRQDIGTETCDIAVANILAEVLVILTPFIVPCIKKGGIFITSGILKGKEDMVSEAMKKAGIGRTEVDYDGEWAGVTGFN